MCKLNYVLLVIFAVAAGSVPAQAQTSSVSESGSVGLSFLNIAPNARIAALGGSSTSTGTGASAMWSNPSLIAFQEERSADFSHLSWIEGINHEYAGFVTPMDYGVLGLSAQLFDSGDIEGRDQYGGLTGNYNITNAALAIDYAFLPRDWIAVGVKYKRLFQKISEDTANGYAVDAGITVKTPLEGINAGVSARNYGSMGTLRNEKTKLPSSVSMGVSKTGVAAMLAQPYTVVADVIFPRFGDTGLRVGAEVSPVNHFNLRAAYRNDSDFEDMIFGIGFAWEKVSADIAYSPLNGISDDAFRFTLTITGF